MFAHLLRHARFSNVVALLALFVALGGGAYAAVSGIPGSDGVIHACFQKKSGALRVVKAGKRCGKKQQALSFNQRGPAGPQGLKGDTGSVDASNFYSKAESDARFLQANGHLIMAQPVTFAQGATTSTPIISVPGVGQIELGNCHDPGSGNVTRIGYHNTSSATEDLIQDEEHQTAIASGGGPLDPDQVKPTLDMGIAGGTVHTNVVSAGTQVEITTVWELLPGNSCRFWARALVFP